MILSLIALVPLAIWAYLLIGRGGFWLCRERDEVFEAEAAEAEAPSVAAVIPARNEAESIAECLGSLLRQDYPRRFSIAVVDDQSSDDTAAVARAAAAAEGMGDRVTIVAGSAPPPGWTGKLWAMRQGLVALEALSPAPEFILFTDADIAYAPRTLRRLAAFASSSDRVLVSVMAKLRCVSFAERLLAPAFVFFFQMIYPFAWVNDPRRRTAAAAGGCMLVKRAALKKAGGIEKLSGALIDDCALARLMKHEGAIWLGLSNDVESLRAHADVADFGQMVVRSAFAQLRYSTVLLIATLAAMAATFLAPPLLALFAHGPAEAAGAIAWIAMAVAFAPMLGFYGRPAIFGFALPGVAALYAAFTIASALQHGRGRGGAWKGRFQTSMSRTGGA